MSDGVPPEERRTDKGVAHDLSQDERTNPATRWPRRNSQGRIVEWRHLLEAVVVLYVVGMFAVVVVDALSTWAGIGDFGQTSGWLAGVMAFWLYVEEFRAWRGTRSRVLVALAAGLVALAVGALAGFALSSYAPLVSGFAGAAVACFGYAPLWFYGIRRAVDREAGE
jgi:hypothetical protein